MFINRKGRKGRKERNISRLRVFASSRTNNFAPFALFAVEK